MDFTLYSRHIQPSVSTADRAMIDAFIATKGVRRFEMGLRTGIHDLKDFLEARGYQVFINGHWRGGIRIRRPGETSKHAIRQTELVKLVDEIRRSEGKRPILLEA